MAVKSYRSKEQSTAKLVKEFWGWAEDWTVDRAVVADGAEEDSENAEHEGPVARSNLVIHDDADNSPGTNEQEEMRNEYSHLELCGLRAGGSFCSW